MRQRTQRLRPEGGGLVGASAEAMCPRCHPSSTSGAVCESSDIWPRSSVFGTDPCRRSMRQAPARDVIYLGVADGGATARQAISVSGSRPRDRCAAALGTASAASVLPGRDGLGSARLRRRVPRMIV
jgi:hypothetical protein